MLCGDLNGKEMQKRGNICIQIVDSVCSIAKNNTKVQSNYTLIKLKNKLNYKDSLFYFLKLIFIGV